MLDAGSSLYIISLSILNAVGILRDRITRQPIEPSSFRGNYTYTIGFVNLDLTVGPIPTAHKFHVTDSWTTFTTWY